MAIDTLQTLDVIEAMENFISKVTKSFTPELILTNPKSIFYKYFAGIK